MVLQRRLFFGCCVVGAMLVSTANAQDLIYRPLNPGLGGNPDLYPYLIDLAGIQSRYNGGSGGGSGGAPVINFPDISIDLGGGVAPNNNTPAPTPPANPPP
jgi:hypothetical protein